MIFFDTTQSAGVRHRSGLSRVTSRLVAELGGDALAFVWGAGGPNPAKADWWLTADLFSEAERPGITAFLRSPPCRTAAIFHDAIPLRYPKITWPKSVGRHPEYMKLLSLFDRVWAVSAASREELLGFWRWQGVENPPQVEVLALGADFNGGSRALARAEPPPPRLLCVGILEPRKNQLFLLEVCDELRREGLLFELDLVGRVNPHFGAPIQERIRQLQKAWPGLRHHAVAGDGELQALYLAAHASVFPTIAEGCGLPILESLWMGVPCLCSDLPVLRENAEAGGCAHVKLGDKDLWKIEIRKILTDRPTWERLSREAALRPLPTWSMTAAALKRGLAS